jgi:hypothetical protein
LLLYFIEGFDHLEREPYYAAVLAHLLEVDGLIVVVHDRPGEEIFVVM